MTRRPSRENQIQRFSQKTAGRYPNKNRRPFWLPASSYYILTVSVITAIFFLIWGILHEGGDVEMPWIPAGIGASVILASAVFLREVVLRKARNRFLSAQKQLDYNIKNIPLQFQPNRAASKLSLERNTEIIKEIRHKSDAARVLRKLPDVHWEVFEVCNEYLLVSKKELQSVSAGSPRLAALRRGRETVKKLHKFHLLSWAEIKSRELTQEAKNQFKVSEKLQNAQKALTVLESALQFYPNDEQLKASEEVVKEFVASIKISHWIEQAERAAFKENYKRAISYYQDALFFLTRENTQSGEEKRLITNKINSEIEKIQLLGNKNKENRVHLNTSKPRKEDD